MTQRFIPVATRSLSASRERSEPQVMTPFGKLETALAAALIVCAALRSPDGATAALALILILEIMKAM